ncbi:MAG: MarR family transcriptional regulator [Bacteroidota bacterium]
MPDTDRIEEVIYYMLDRTIKRTRQVTQVYFQRYGVDVTVDQWLVFKVISETDGINQVEVAARLYKDPASITRIIDALIQKGLVQKQLDPNDRRRYLLALTESGKIKSDEWLALVKKMRRVGIQGFDEQEISQLKDYLNRIFENVDAIPPLEDIR